MSPSVLSLALDNNLTKEEVLEKVPASGPKGRVLKGDILAYLGKIPRSDVDSLADTIEKWQHLDLSNITIKKAQPSAPSSTPTPAKDVAASAAPSSKTETPSEQPPKKKAPEPKPKLVLNSVYTLAEINNLKQTLDTTIGTSASAKSLVEKASKLALRDSIKLSKSVQAKKSVLIDPIFEELLAPSVSSLAGKKPFSVSIKYPQTSSSKLAFSSSSSNDFYDDLLGGVGRKSAVVPSSELLTVDVTVDESYPGGAAKAQIYLDRLGYYLSQGKGELIL